MINEINLISKICTRDINCSLCKYFNDILVRITILRDKIVNIALYRMGEMLFGCIVPSVFICLLCVTGPMPVGSTQRDVTLIGAPVAFIVWNIYNLRWCYKALGGNSLYYYVNICGYSAFAIINICSYIVLPADAYTWIFVITRFARYSSLGITSPVAITLFHIILFISIFLAPIGLSWIKLKEKEEEELREMAPGILEVNPLEQKRKSTEVQTNEIQKTKEKDSLS